MNKNALRAALALNSTSQEEMAKQMGISGNTLSRKINGLTDFNLGEVNKIKAILNLSREDLIAIFFTENVDKKATD